MAFRDIMNLNSSEQEDNVLALDLHALNFKYCKPIVLFLRHRFRALDKW